MYYVKTCVCLVVLLIALPITNSFALTEESQRILSKYQEYKENNYAPTPNKKQPNTSPTQNSQSKSNSPSQIVPNVNLGSNQIVIVAFIILVIIAAAFAGTRKHEWGSWDHPPSMKQLAWLRNRGYGGRMPTSSRDAHKIISDIRRGGDGDYERDDYDDRRSRF